MWRFKATKYKNAAPRFPKKEEWISDISTTALLHSCGNHVKASGAYMVFNIDNSGGNTLGILPLDFRGRVNIAEFPTIQAHSDYVTDFDFNPFDDYVLATCSQDGQAKIWKFKEEVSGKICNAEVTIAHEDRKIENIQWHPITDNVLSLSTGKTIKVYDVDKNTPCFDLALHNDQIQSFSWSRDGKLIASSCKDKVIRILDPRQNQCAQETTGHPNIKDSRVIWLDSEYQILSSGFDMMRQREIVLRDVRNMSTSLKTCAVDTSTGILIPLFDPDSKMIFLAGKGDTCLRFMEITDNDPYVTDGSVDTVEQIKGATLVPKRALNVMDCEVNRVLILSKNALIPLPYHVPRKSYQDFHEDLFPETFSGIPAMTSSEWLNGTNELPSKVSLNPSKKTPRIIKRDPSGKTATAQESASSQWKLPQPMKESSTNTAPKPPISGSKPSKVSTLPSPNQGSGEDAAAAPPAVLREKKAVKSFSGVRQSKFRHLKGTPVHKSDHYENLRNVSKNIPGESDMFCANTTFCAIPLGGPGGLVAPIKMNNPGRLPDTGVPALQNGSSVTDFTFDPFDNRKLVVASDDAKIRIWAIPKEGLDQTLAEPDGYLHGHSEKIYFLKFHPLAKDIIASGSYDMSVIIWDLAEGDKVFSLEGHTDTIFSFAWSSDGVKCATLCKDGIIRLYDPRKSESPEQEGQGPEGTRGARIVWVLEGKYIAVSGFDKLSSRVVSIYDAENISKGPLYKENLDTSPAILIPYYDEDSSTLFLTGRGDSTVKAFEIGKEFPHLFALSDCKFEGPHQGLAFLPKTECNVKQAEFARALRLTPNTIEPVSFTVPRVKTEFFQDDLFPDTKVTWEPSLTSAEWCSGVNRLPKVISMKPKDMTSLTDAPKEAPKQQKYERFEDYQKHYKTDEQKKEELLSAMNAKLEIADEPLPQDLTEGVDEDEWDDY